MSKTVDSQVAAAAEKLGLPAREVAEVSYGPHGQVVKTTDGQSYVIVDEDTPDGEGRHGVMYLSAPSEGYAGPTPVFVSPSPIDPDVVVTETPDAPAVVDDELEGLRGWNRLDLEAMVKADGLVVDVPAGADDAAYAEAVAKARKAKAAEIAEAGDAAPAKAEGATKKARS